MELSAQWIVGFVDGEGCFHVGINKQPSMTIGYQVLPEFTVVQHERDVQLLHALKAFFTCGVVRKNKGKQSESNTWAYRVRAHEHLMNHINPFFMKHSLKSKKNIEFKKFRRIVLMMDKGKHLTEDGLEEIRELAG